MFCPQCGQERVSIETNYCSRCGYLLTGTAEVLENDGVIPGAKNSELPKSQSPRNRGVKQGIFIFLLTFLIVPVIAVIESSFNEYFNVTLITTAVLGVGGLLRIAYALMFEAVVAGTPAIGTRDREIKSLSARDATSADIFAAPITGNWRTTEELQTTTVSEGETKKLEHDADQ